MRTLTAEDLKDIRDAIAAERPCQFDSETREILKTLTTIYRDGRSVLLKALIGAMVVGGLYIAVLGAGLFRGRIGP